MLVPDPTFRPRAAQLHEHLLEISVLNGWNLDEKIDFEKARTPVHMPAANRADQTANPAAGRQHARARARKM